jgi:hypothetical protein
MATSKHSKGQNVLVAKQLIAATAKHLTNSTPVAFAGSSFTADQIASKLQVLVNLRADVDAAKAAAQAKVSAEVTQSPPVLAFMSAYRAFLKVHFSTSPDVLADFGVNPKARAPVTAEVKVAAVAKRAATRAARHTLGSKQKQGIKGAVTGVIVTPVTASSPIVTAASSPTAPATSVGPTAAATPHTA